MRRKNIVVMGILLLLILGGLYIKSVASPQVKSSQSKIITYTLEGKKLRLYVADTPEQQERGLMFVRKLDDVDGMIFLFPEKEMQSFWNKNTFMDLDLYWIDREKVVGKSFLPSIEKSKDIVIVDSPSMVDKVIEIPTVKR